MNVPFNDLSFQNQSIIEEINAQIDRCIGESVYIGGEEVGRFEESFASYIGVNHCIGTGNCTDAMELILEGYGIGKGDEVIVPAYTWVSSASCVARVGATPVFVDVHPEYYTLDTELLEASISKNTKAIIVVHFYGLAAEMDEINMLADKYGLKVIEDCAQATGAEYKGSMVGSIGDAAAFSFYPTKNLGAFGDGGCVTTNNSRLSREIRKISNHGQQGKNKHRVIGRNSRLDTIQAAILNVKLKYVDDWNNERIRSANKYMKRLRGNMVKLPEKPEYSKHVYHLFVIQIEGNYQIQGYLENKGIESFIHYPLPVPELMPFEKYKQYGDCYTVSKRMACRILSLPIFPGITDKQIAYVCSNLEDAISFCG